MSPQVHRQIEVPHYQDLPSDDPSDKEELAADHPSSSQQPRASQRSHQDDEEAGPSGVTPTTSGLSSHTKKSQNMTPVDEAIIMMVRSLAQNQDLRNSIIQVLDVQMNPRKAFCVWFTSEAMAIPEPSRHRPSSYSTFISVSNNV